MRKSRQLFVVAAGAIALSLTACSSGTSTPTASGSGSAGNSGQTLIVYTNSNSDGRAEWLTSQAAAAGFNIQIVGQGGGDTTNKLIAEKNNPVADVVFGLNNMYFETLEAADVLTDYTPSWSDEVDPALGDADASKSYWPVVQQGILLACNSAAAQLPAAWPDMWNDAQFHGRYQSETSLGGATTQLTFAGILSRYRDANGTLGISDDGWAQIQGYFDYGSPAEQGVDMYVRMASGAIECGQMWSSGVPKFEQTYNITTAVVKPSYGVPYAIEQVALVAGSSKEAEAKAFIDWFGGADLQSAWSAQFDSMPANEGAIAKADPAIVTFHEDLPRQDIDWDFVRQNMPQWVEKIELEYMK